MSGCNVPRRRVKKGLSFSIVVDDIEIVRDERCRTVQFESVARSIWVGNKLEISWSRFANAVPDAIAGIWFDGNVELWDEPVIIPHGCGCLVGRGCIILLAESPHKDEFETGTRRPLSPLRCPDTRKAIEQHLENLIVNAKEFIDTEGMSLAYGAQIVFMNPIQFQTSLADCMGSDEDGMLDRVRDAVWRAMFRHEMVEADFDRRLFACQPSLILSAPTGSDREEGACRSKGVRPVMNGHLSEMLASGLNSTIVSVSPHPSWWKQKAPKILRKLGRPSAQELKTTSHE